MDSPEATPSELIDLPALLQALMRSSKAAL